MIIDSNILQKMTANTLKFSKEAPITGTTAVALPRNNEETAVSGPKAVKQNPS